MVVQKKEEEKVGRVQRFLISASSQWNSFMIFLWNPAEKTVMGRGGKSWGQILIFYMFYYSFLAALFAISITIVLGTLDPYTPRFQTRLQGPGVSIQPRAVSDVSLTSDIVYSVSSEKDRNHFKSLMKDFLAGYDNQTDDKFQDCANNTKIEFKKFNGDETVKACRFDRSSLGACGTEPYGYDAGKPCILVKVNRIIGWFPVAFHNLSNAVGLSLSKAPPLKQVLTVNRVQYNPYTMYVACYGLTEADQKNLNGEVGPSTGTKYFPSGISFKYYPYYGNKRSPDYLSPVVAVQFENVTRNTEIRVGCKAYARNIIDDHRMQIGYYTFLLNVKD